MNSMVRWILLMLQGIGIGAANVIPGVSGGTMALIFGIYERIIQIAERSVKAIAALARLDFRSFVGHFMDLEWPFLIPLIVGVLVVPFAGARLISELLESWPEHSRALFFGLILGSIAIPWLRTSHIDFREYGLAIAAVAVAFVLSGLPPTELTDPTLLQYFFAAAIAVSAMILPGISGAFILLVFGMYEPVFRAIEAWNFLVITVFGLGAVIGLGLFSLVLGWLLRRYHDRTMVVLVGLMVGSLRALWPWLDTGRGLEWPAAHDSVGGILVLMGLGLAFSMAITWWEILKRKERILDGP